MLYWDENASLFLKMYRCSCYPYNSGKNRQSEGNYKITAVILTIFDKQKLVLTGTSLCIVLIYTTFVQTW